MREKLIVRTNAQICNWETNRVSDSITVTVNLDIVGNQYNATQFNIRIALG